MQAGNSNGNITPMLGWINRAILLCILAASINLVWHINHKLSEMHRSDCGCSLIHQAAANEKMAGSPQKGFKLTPDSGK